MASKFFNIRTGFTGSLITSLPGTVEKVKVNSHSSGVFRLIDNASKQGDAPALGVGGDGIMGSFTCPTGAGVYPIQATFASGIFCATSGQVDLEVYYNGDPIR